MKGDGKDGERRTTDGGTGQRGLQGMKCDFGAWDGRAEGGNGERKGRRKEEEKRDGKLLRAILTGVHKEQPQQLNWIPGAMRWAVFSSEGTRRKGCSNNVPVHRHNHLIHIQST